MYVSLKFSKQQTALKHSNQLWEAKSPYSKQRNCFSFKAADNSAREGQNRCWEILPAWIPFGWFLSILVNYEWQSLIVPVTEISTAWHRHTHTHIHIPTGLEYFMAAEKHWFLMLWVWCDLLTVDRLQNMSAWWWVYQVDSNLKFQIYIAASSFHMMITYVITASFTT